MPIKCGFGPDIGQPLERHGEDGGVSVKFTTTTVKTVIGAAGIAGVSVLAATTASAATPNIKGFGTSESLINGSMVNTYAVSNLEASSFSIQGYTPKGTLIQEI